MEWGSLVPVETSTAQLPHLGVVEAEGAEGFKSPEKQGVCYEIVFPRNVWSYAYKVSNMVVQTWAEQGKEQ